MPTKLSFILKHHPIDFAENLATGSSFGLIVTGFYLENYVNINVAKFTINKCVSVEIRNDKDCTIDF